MASSSSAPKTEYQHFVPQFLVRNFAHPYKPPKGAKNRKQPKGKAGKLYAGNPVVNHVNLTANPIAIQESLVKRILGMPDMYQDTTQATAKQQHHIEELFGRLESEVSPIFRKMVKSFEAGEAGLWLSRDERNCVRRFLFLLKYRASAFHRRFYHDSADDYDSNDKEPLRVYMKEKGFVRPMDVWFDNIKAIAELRMDAEEKWMSYILGRIYPVDAGWFISNVQQMYMAICTPTDAGDDFVLTDNAYGIFEGPNQFQVNPTTGKLEAGMWTNFHEFSPVSPKLMIVLRSFLLPVPEEDSYETSKQDRERWRTLCIKNCFPPGTESALADLPISKARNSYTEIVNSRFVPLQPDHKKRKDDKFCFQFFRIHTEHVDKINGFLIDNAYHCTSIVFGSQQSFLKTLEYYMTEPCVNYKIIIRDDDHDSRLAYVENLAALMKGLGSDAEAVWNDSPAYVGLLSEFDKMSLMNLGIDAWLEEMKDVKWGDSVKTDESSSSKVLQVHTTLGGSKDTILYDLEQTRRMLQLRIKLDVWSKGTPEWIRERNRELLTDAYLRLPSARVWLYAKRIRMMILCHNKDVDLMKELNGQFSSQDMPEDIIARGACHLANQEKLNRLIFNTMMNSVEKKKNPTFDPWANVGFSVNMMTSLMRSRKFVTRPGNLKECGIKEIEKMAIDAEGSAIRRQMHRQEEFVNDLYSEEETLEVVVRVLVRSKVKQAIGHTTGTTASMSALAAMEKVWFEFTYPAPP